ncbi:MAG: hypothetical protein QM725_11215 [Lacibacter sp.]
MKKLLTTANLHFIIVSVVLFTHSACLTPKKADSYIAEQYGNQLPKLNKKKIENIDVKSTSNSNNNLISTTIKKTDKFLPLIVYWKFDHRIKSSLNPAIAITNFTNNLNSAASKELIQKLNGRKLELTVEQVPVTFSLVYKENVIWVIYAFSWTKIFVEPELTDLVVSYKLTESGDVIKTGTITIKNTDSNKGLRLFQTWKSAFSEYIIQYNTNNRIMTSLFVKQLLAEI